MEQTTGQLLKRRKVIILGGSSGIGLATAIDAMHQGAEVIIVSSNQHRIDSVINQQPSIKGFAVDLAKEDLVKDFFDSTGNFDHLVFTAGENLQLNNIENIITADAKKFFELRFWGAFTAVKYAAKYINNGGSITLSGGVAGQKPGKGWLVGASICMAMEGLTRAMAVELAPIRVNLVSPGIVKTNLWSNMKAEDREMMFAQTAQQLPVKYVAGAADIAKTYLYLMGQPYITGQIIVVDGGYLLM